MLQKKQAKRPRCLLIWVKNCVDLKSGSFKVSSTVLAQPKGKNNTSIQPYSFMDLITEHLKNGAFFVQFRNWNEKWTM